MQATQFCMYHFAGYSPSFHPIFVLANIGDRPDINCTQSKYDAGAQRHAYGSSMRVARLRQRI
jgi:hypothetical protein